METVSCIYTIDPSLVYTVLAIFIAVIALFSGFMIWAFTKLDGDIKGLGNKLDADIKMQTIRIDAQMSRIDKMHALFSERTDQMYNIFIGLLKEKKL